VLLSAGSDFPYLPATRECISRSIWGQQSTRRGGGDLPERGLTWCMAMQWVLDMTRRICRANQRSWAVPGSRQAFDARPLFSLAPPANRASHRSAASGLEVNGTMRGRTGRSSANDRKVLIWSRTFRLFTLNPRIYLQGPLPSTQVVHATGCIVGASA